MSVSEEKQDSLQLATEFIKVIIKSILFFILRLLIFYLAYRLINILVVYGVSYLRKDDIASAANRSESVFAEIQSPAPRINDCVDYQLLAERYKFFISEQEYDSCSDYLKQARTMNLCNIFLPITAVPEYFEPAGASVRGTSGGTEYLLDVDTGINVFTLEPEESFSFRILSVKK